MDRFDALSAFVAVCDTQGFATAARRLGLSASAVTRLVAGLEQRLGVRLLNRTTRALSLTDAGARFLEQARQILGDLSLAEQSVTGLATAPRGRLVIAAPTMFGRLHVAPLLSRYLARWPEVQAELRLSDSNANLVEEGIDLAVRIGDLADSSLVARRVGETGRVLVASPDYVARRGAPKRPEDLAAHDTIAFSSLFPPVEWTFHKDGVHLPVRVAPRFATNSSHVAINEAIAGGGLTFVLAYQAAEDIRSGALVMLMADYAPPPRPIHLVFPSSRLLGVNVRAFVDQAASETRWTDWV